MTKAELKRNDFRSWESKPVFSRDFSDPSELSSEIAHLKGHRDMVHCRRTSQGTLQSVKDSNAAQDSREITTMQGKKPEGEIKFQSKHSQGAEQHRCLFCTVTLADHSSSSPRDSYSQKM